MQPSVELSRSRSGRTVVVKPDAPVALDAGPWLGEALDEAYRSTARVIVVDLQAYASISRAEVDELLSAYRSLKRGGRPLVVVNIRPAVVQALRTLDGDHELPQVPLERLLSSAWLELGALQPQAETSFA
ncbi:MAG: hypothetical protein JWO60_1378 [Frankiales bacterium]|nr:hypothetical protein [Frankiales bacterium]